MHIDINRALPYHTDTLYGKKSALHPSLLSLVQHWFSQERVQKQKAAPHSPLQFPHLHVPSPQSSLCSHPDKGLEIPLSSRPSSLLCIRLTTLVLGKRPVHDDCRSRPPSMKRRFQHASETFIKHIEMYDSDCGEKETTGYNLSLIFNSISVVQQTKVPMTNQIPSYISPYHIINSPLDICLLVSSPLRPLEVGTYSSLLFLREDVEPTVYVQLPIPIDHKFPLLVPRANSIHQRSPRFTMPSPSYASNLPLCMHNLAQPITLTPKPPWLTRPPRLPCAALAKHPGVG